MDLDGPYVVLPPNDDENTSRQWVIVRADLLAERLRRRATDEAWEEGQTQDEPIPAVAAYDDQGIADTACLMLNQDAPTERAGASTKPTRGVSWGLHGAVTGMDIHRESVATRARALGLKPPQ